MQESGEPGVSGVTMQLVTDGFGLVESTTTAADGSYSFGVENGDLCERRVRLVVPNPGPDQRVALTSYSQADSATNSDFADTDSFPLGLSYGYTEVLCGHFQEVSMSDIEVNRTGQFVEYSDPFVEPDFGAPVTLDVGITTVAPPAAPAPMTPTLPATR